MKRYVLLAVFAAIFGVSLCGMVSDGHQAQRDKSLNIELHQIVDREEDKNYEVNFSNTSLAVGINVKKDFTSKVPTYKIEEPVISDKFVELYARNPDLVGWIDNGDFLDYPIVQNIQDSDYYLYRDFDGNDSKSGTLYIPSNCSLDSESGVIPIYGLCMRNDTMFGALDRYLDKKYFDSHRTITISTLYEEETYEVIGAFLSQVYDSSYTGFKYYSYKGEVSEEEFTEYIAGVNNLLSIGDVSDLEYGDKVVELVTCAYHVDNGKLVIICRKQS